MGIIKQSLVVADAGALIHLDELGVLDVIEQAKKEWFEKL